MLQPMTECREYDTSLDDWNLIIIWEENNVIERY